jgi:diguanylate cyclase (GGDEF)-like protein
MIKKFLGIVLGLIILFILMVMVGTYNFFMSKLKNMQMLFQTYQYHLVMQERRDLLSLINQVLQKRFETLEEQLLERKIIEIKTYLKALDRLITLDKKITKQVIDTFFLSNTNLEGFAVKDGIIISSSNLLQLGQRVQLPCNPKNSILHQCELFANGYYYFVLYNQKYDLYLVGYTKRHISDQQIREDILNLLHSFPNVIVAPKDVIENQPDIVYREFKPLHIYYGLRIDRAEIQQLVENALSPIRGYFRSLFFQYTLGALVFGTIIITIIFFVIFRKADRLEQIFRETEMKALKDPLTGLYNRDGFAKIYYDQMGGRCTLVIIDLDNFKYINDTFGHPRGDQVLKFVANLLRSYFPDSAIARWGGDEFILCTRLPVKEIKSRLYTIQKAIQDFQESFDPKMEKVVSISVGICADQNLSYEEKFKRADLALYKSKKKGKGLILLYRELDYVRIEKEDL